MEETYISKKELLEVTGISYGQLYRWKRMNIIPENWFIKKSSFTGQETYFPRDKVLERIQKILELKDDYSLEELAEFFSPKADHVEMMTTSLLTHHIVSKEVIQASNYPPNEKLSFTDIFYLYMCDWISKEYRLSHDSLVQQLSFLKEGDFVAEEVELVALKKEEVRIWFIVASKELLFVEDSATVLVKVSIVEKLNELKTKLSEVTK
ncbi:DUF4004 family protein [Bacillus sp. BGMRC 2118]|nr:DUF4004 family protein [Bacillus sp. BGMRC 2118]